MPIKYDKFGLRRDRNLSDVTDSSLALTNILNDLALPGQTFIDKDLLVINNLAQTDVTSGDFINIADSAVKTTQLRKVYNVLVEFPNPNVSVEPGFEFLIGDVDATLINVSQINPPDETLNENEFFETILSIQTPPVELQLELGDTLDIANVPYTILAVIGVNDTQNVFTLKPQVTLNDQLQFYYLTSGDEIKTLSGNGLNSYFFPSTEINPILDNVDTAEDIIRHPLTNFNPLLYGPFDFWDNGAFWLDRKIFNTNRFNDTAGGIFWEGHVNADPLSAESVSRYEVLTNGYFMFDYYDEGQQRWINVSRLAPTALDVQHQFRREGEIYLGENIIGFSSALDVLPEVMFVEGIFHKIIEDGVEVTPVDNRVFAKVQPLDSTEAFEAGLDPIGARVYSKIVLEPASENAGDSTGDVVITQSLYNRLEAQYFAEQAELDETPEFFPGRYFITSDISTSADESTAFTMNVFPISDGTSSAKSARFELPRTTHYLEVIQVRFVCWWPQQIQGWDEKIFVFSNISNVFESSFSVFNKTYDPTKVPDNRESLNNTFLNASKRGLNILEEGLNIENTLRVTSTPPTSFRHAITTDDIEKNTLDNPRHDYEMHNLIPNYFGAPGVGTYQLPRGPFQAEKSVRNLTVRPGEFLINHWNENFYNTKHVGQDQALAELGIGLNCIDQISPAELLRISTPETQFLSQADETVYDETAARIYYGGLDISEFSGRYEYDTRPFASAFKALTTQYSSLLDDLPGIGIVIDETTIEAHNTFAKNAYPGDERWIRKQFNVTEDIQALPYVGLGSENHFNVLEALPEIGATYFTGAVSGSDLGFFQQLSIPNINLVDILATPISEPKNALSSPTRNFTYESILVDTNSTLGPQFIKKDNFVTGFKTFSDLVYSPYFTTKRVAGSWTGGVITSTAHGFDDRQVVIYHTPDSSDVNYQAVRKYIQFKDTSGEYEIQDQPDGGNFPAADINLIVDTNNRLSSYQRKGLVNVVDADTITLNKVDVQPLTQPKFYLDNADSMEMAVRYLRDVSTLGINDFTEAQITSSVAFAGPASNVVVDLVEYDDSSFPESVLGISLFGKYDLETDILDIVPYFPTESFREQTVGVDQLVDGEQFVIVSAGDTDFTLVGAADSVDGTIFTCSNASSVVGTSGTVRHYLGVDLNGDEVVIVPVTSCINPVSQIAALVLINQNDEEQRPFLYPERILAQTPDGWVLQTTSQTYTKESVLEPILNPGDSRVQFNAANFFVNGAQRITTFLFDPENTELDQDPNPYDAPLSGTWDITTINYPNNTDGVYVVDDTFEGAPVGPITDDQSSTENSYLNLGPSEVYLRDTRPFDWTRINGSDASNYSQTTPNGKLFVRYESSVFGKTIDKDDTGYNPGAIDELVEALAQQYAATESFGQYNLDIPNRMTKYFNTITSKSMFNGVYAPIISHTDLPLAIEKVTQLPDGKVDLEFKNFNNIPEGLLFTKHNGVEESGVLVDPWATEYIAVYSDKSVVDYSKLTYCQDVIPLEVPLGANAGATELVVPTGLAQTGYFVQFSGYVSDGTTITNVTTGAPYDTITISAPLLERIEPEYVITTAPDNLRDYELCTLTLNTAPPFEGTELGLVTTTNAPELEVAELIFENLSIKSTTTTPITDEELASEALTINYVDDALEKTPYKLISK